MKSKTIYPATVLVLFIFLITGNCFSRDFSNHLMTSRDHSMKSFSGKLMNDTLKSKLGKSNSKKTNMGGLFIAPTIGVSFPVGKFADYSNSGIIYGVKAELAYSRLYPFIFGFVYEYQKLPGSGEFTTTNSLTKYDTKISSIGGSLDIILNKFLRSDFTTPVLMLELKYAKVTKDVSPLTTNSEIPGDKSLLTYAAGMGFTIYIFDLCTKYTFAGDYSSLTFQAKFHFPLIKF